MPTINTFLVSVTLLLVILGLSRRSRRSLPLPPGPRGWPLIGNLYDAPNEYQWIRYAEMSKKYKTNVLYLKVIRTPVIVLSSVESVKELLGRRSSLTSSRPTARMLMELMGWRFNMSFTPYGGRWRTRRRVFWQEFNPSNSAEHRETQLKHAGNFLKRLLEDPDNLFYHARYIPAAIIVEIAYGMDIQFKDDPTIARSDHALHYLNAAGTVGTYLVDYLPLLKYVPRWLPGAGFRKFADQSCEEVKKMCDIPYKQAIKLIGEGKAARSLVSRSLAIGDSLSQNEDVELVIKDVAAVAYVGGADTTPSSIISFFAAMVLHPDIQKKAQDELDAALGSRLPSFEDFHSLPFIEAIMWETLRWKPVVPLGIVHMSLTDDVYNGCCIPAGSNIFCNIWEIMRDETLFPDPTTFNPNRFLKQGKIDRELTDIVELVFGSGRRICPGRFMAMNTLLILMSYTLAVFNITKAKGEDGNDVVPDTELVPGFISQLRPFRCSILPRSEIAKTLIHDAGLL